MRSVVRSLSACLALFATGHLVVLATTNALALDVQDNAESVIAESVIAELVTTEPAAAEATVTTAEQDQSTEQQDPPLANQAAIIADQDEPDPPTDDVPVPATSPTPGEHAPLSVAPLDQVEFPADRPEWILAGNELSGSTHRWVVRTSLCDTPEESEQQLVVMLAAALNVYAEQLTGSAEVGDVLPIEDAEMREQLIAQRYQGTVKQGTMDLYESAVELKFSLAVQEQIRQAALQVDVRKRLGAMGVLTAGGLALLMFGSFVAGTVSRRVERRERIATSAR